MNLKGLEQYVAKNGAVLVTGIIDKNSGRVIQAQADKCKAIADHTTVLIVDRKCSPKGYVDRSLKYIDRIQGGKMN